MPRMHYLQFVVVLVVVNLVMGALLALLPPYLALIGTFAFIMAAIAAYHYHRKDLGRVPITEWLLYALAAGILISINYSTYLSDKNDPQADVWSNIWLALMACLGVIVGLRWLINRRNKMRSTGEPGTGMR